MFQTHPSNVCFVEVCQVAAGCEHSAHHPPGEELCGRDPPPLVGPRNTDLLQPALRVPAPGLH